MKITKFLFPALIMFLGVSCTHDNSETDYLKNTKSYEDTNWGDLHNKFMSSVKNDFIPNYGSSYEEEEAQLLNFYHDITEEEQSLNDKNKTLFKNSFSDRIKLVNYKYIQAVVKDEQLIYNDLKKENTTFSQYILDLQNTHIISNSEINDIIELHQILKDIYKKNYSIHNLNQYLREKPKNKDQVVMNIALDIGKYSNDWWHNNLDQIYIADNELNFTTNTLTKEYNYSDIDITIVNELPVVVANDIAGALVGGTISIGVQYASSGSVNWTGVGYSAAASAIIASTGLIGKIGGWISRW